MTQERKDELRRRAEAEYRATKEPSALPPSEDREASQLVRSGDLLGARPRLRRRPSLLVSALAAAVLVGGRLPLGLAGAPREPREKTPDDLLRLALAEDKRERKRLRKEAAKTKAPNVKDEPRTE